VEAQETEVGGPAGAAYWHPFTAAGSYTPRVIVEADGCTVIDATGRPVLDLAAGLWCVNVGWGRRAIADAMARQAEKLPYYSSFSFTTEPAARLADRVAALLPGSLDHVFFTNSGSEAVDTALKIARAYWVRRGEPRRRVLVGRHLAYHGVNFGGLSVSGIPRNQVPFGPLLPEVAHAPHNHCFHCPFDLTYPECGIACGRALEEVVQTYGPETIAAVIVEPVMGAGGVIPPPEGYLTLLADICRRHGILLIFDEVITGFGRLGTWFAAQRFNVEPDLVCLAKGLSSGYAPIGAVAATSAVHAAFVDPGGELELPHGYTYSGHPVSCAAALANLDIMEREDLPARAAAIEAKFLSALHTLTDLPSVAEVRGIGLLGGIELVAGADRAKAATNAAWENGVIVRQLAGTLALSPPLVVTEDEIERGVSILRDALV
jgi:beta-alanine--pyruvate transaminase